MTQVATPLVQLALDGAFTALEEKWVQAVESGFRDLDAYFKAADTTVASGRGEVAGPLLGTLLEALIAEALTDEVVDFAERSVLLCIADKSVRASAAALHRKAGRLELAALVAPLDGSNSDVVRERVAKCLRLKPGTFVSGTQRTGPERVERFDTDALLFWLTDSTSERSLAPDAAAHELTILPSEDFRALLRFDTQRLVAMADADPAALVISALRSHRNRLEWQSLKKLLARGVVDPTGFARWWNRSKGHLERNPLVQMYGDRQPILILRERPITHEEELAGKLRAAKNDYEKLTVVLDYVASLEQGHEKNVDFLRACANALADVAGSPSTKPALAVAAVSVFDEVVKLGGDPGRPIDVEALAARAGDLGDLSTVMGSEDLLGRVLDFARRLLPERWPAVYSKALPHAPGRLAEVIARELLAAGRGDELSAAVKEILASPERYGEGLFWLWKAATSKALDGAPVRIDKCAITLALLRVMNRWARGSKTQVSAAQKALLARMRSALVTGNYRVILGVLEQVDDAQAIQLYATIRDNMGLTDAQRHKLSEQLKHDHKDAILGRKELWEEDVIYTSARGLRQRQDEFNKIVNIDMVSNSEAIGEAAGFGDLSENAEFTAALEKRDFLAARANDIGDELKKAMLIPDDIKNDRVTVGTTVRVKDLASGQVDSITFLGPWDASLEKRIYSYLAPFALTYLGKKVGEIVDDGEHKAEIVGIDYAEIPT